MNIQVIQPAKKQLTAYAYDKATAIAMIEHGDVKTIVGVLETKSQKHTYMVFQIRQYVITNHQEVTIRTTNTTNYHKALGIAVSMNA